MRVKVCGITSEAGARAALRAGVDWIGLNLVAGPRRIDLDAATNILTALPDPSRAVVLLREDDPDFDANLAALRGVGAACVQWYGATDVAKLGEIRAAGWTVATVHHVEREASVDGIDRFFADRPLGTRPDFLLLDAKSGDRLGGTGVSVDWSMLARLREAGRFDTWPPIILAGGLNPKNVAEAIRLVCPAVVDVSSGVECSPGHKDEARMRRFVEAARAAASRLS